MKKLTALCLILVCCSCYDQVSDADPEPIRAENLTSVQIDSVLEGYQFSYEQPIVLDSSEYLLIPISANSINRSKGFISSSRYTDEYGNSYEKGVGGQYWNVIFYNRQTGIARLLTESKYRISEINPPGGNYRQRQGSLRTKILYKLSDIDYNQDQHMNHHDPEYLFVSDLNGENLERLSPPDEDLQYYEVIPEADQILFRTRRDTERDSVFNEKDEVMWYQTTLVGNTWERRAIIDTALQQRIKRLFFEQWLQQ